MSNDRPGDREADDDIDSPDDEGATAMTDVPLLVPAQGDHVMPPAYRAAFVQMADAIVDRIRAEVPAYGGPTGGRRHQLMTMATHAAIRAHLDTSAQHASTRRKVDELFHRMGWGEAQDGNGLGNVELALQVASRVIWRQLTDYAVAHQHSAQSLRDVIDGLVAHRDRLLAELVAGHSLWQRDPHYDEGRARARLWNLLGPGTVGRISPLRALGVDHDDLSAAAAQAGWTVPDQVVAIAVSFHGEPPVVPESHDVLARLEADRLQVLCPAELVDELVAGLTRTATDRRVVISWAVPPGESGTALLWSLRALDLVRLGVIAPTPVVHCADHTIQLWLHAEPSMRRRLCQSLLEPLLAESPNSREILSETLLTWLETRDSAPAIAARLDVHPQTVRYRWRRINELFGEALHDPEFVIQITLVLKSSLLLWKGGDQSDFELFRDSKGAGL
jgi:hypothetical protein